jgi:tripeptidyl-peptidase-2
MHHNSLSSRIAIASVIALAGCASPTIEDTSTEPAGNITNVSTPMPYQPTGGPLDALQPKKETGVDRFLEQYPESDGRGVVVAIFDTGVDPGAPGLQVTSDGQPKIIDVVDGSGSGDVDTSTIAELGDEGTFTGLSGKQLTPHSEWANPTGEYRVGLKPAHEIFPAGLVGRMNNERRKDWDQIQRTRSEQLSRDLAEFDRKTPKPDEDELILREDLVAKIDQLKAMQGSFNDPGPIFDCVVFHDGTTWRASVDTDGDGDFSNETTLTNFRAERQYATFGETDLLNYVLNIYDEGNVLSIVADAGAHGTHVAGIVAAHFPDQPELNGMAPGAQIVAVKIGDTRLGSSSLGTGKTRGYTTVLENDCDLINMSYGGADAFPDTRYRNGQLAAEIVNKNGVIFVSSASNDGPALSTVGGPGGSTSAIIGVGASISPEMMTAQYALREAAAGEMQYPWSSRGPTLDGDLGVDITAPGGAISSVPNWTLQKNMLMNGTSMSSPNTCGGIALILSKLKQDDIDYTPHSVKRALYNSTMLMPGQSPWAQGNGMLQVDSAYEHLINYENDKNRDVYFDMRGPGNERGAYLREPFENNQTTERRVRIAPHFHEDASSRKKVDFEMRIRLEASEPWVQAAEFVNLVNGGDQTDVRIDPTGLPEGAHYAEVVAYDADRPERGALCKYPITVVKGFEVEATDNYIWRDTIGSKPGDLNRWIFSIPSGATWMDLIIRRLDDDTSRLLVVQALQLVDDKPNNHHKFSRWVRFDDDDEQIYTLPVDSGRTLEIVAAQNWSSLGEGEFEFEVRFRGLRPEPSQILIDGGTLVTRFDIHSPMRDAIASPSGSLTGMLRSFRPTDSKIRALDPVRDRLSDDRQMYEIVVDYDITVPEDMDANVNPAVSLVPHAWEIYQSFLWYVYNKDGELLETQAGEDVDISLDEGDYTLKLHVRHDDPDVLAQIEDAPMNLRLSLPNAVGLKFATDPDDSFNGRGGFGSPELEAGSSVPCYIATPKSSSLPDCVEPGDVLVGSFTIGGDTELIGSTTKPGGWPIAMSVIAAPNDKPEVEATESEDEDVADNEPSSLDQLNDDILDLKVERLGELMGEEDADAFDSIASEVLAERPNYMPVLLNQMERAAEGDDSNATIAAAKLVVANVDTEVLAAYIGVNHDKDADDFDEELSDDMDEMKSALTDALTLVAETLGDNAVSDDAASIEDFENAIADLEVWSSIDSDDGFDLRLKREMLHNRHGKALAMLSSNLSDEPDKDVYEQRIELLEMIGWDEWAEHERSLLLTRYPKHTTLF